MHEIRPTNLSPSSSSSSSSQENVRQETGSVSSVLGHSAVKNKIQ